MSKNEVRLTATGVEARDDSATGKRTLVGYAIVYNSPTLIGDEEWGFIEVIAPGAADEAIRGDVVALMSHDRARVLGRTKSGTVRLASDSKGVSVEIDLPDTTDGNDLWELVKRGDISGMSFSFNPTKQEWDDTVRPPKRTITLMDVYEVSGVAFPAYEETELKARAKAIVEEMRSAQPPADTTPPVVEEIPAPPVSRAALNTKARLSMGLDIRVRTKR